MKSDQLRAQLTRGQAEACPDTWVYERIPILEAPKIEIYINHIGPSTIQ
jgi:hypothetical protein